VYLNGGNYYSPELFSPADAAYYTAPNACVPLSARYQGEQTPSFDGSGADSGYGWMTGSGTSPRNSCKQRDEHGDGRTPAPHPSPEPAPTSEKALEAEHKKVLVFDTASEDSNEWSKAKERGRKGASSEKRSKLVTSKSSAKSDDRGRASKPSSSSEKKPHSDRSRSSSSSEKRAASSKKQMSGVKKDIKTVPESSSDDSSSSDGEEQSSQSIMFQAMHMLKPPRFDGQGSFETFCAQFENSAEHNKWTQAQKLVFLKNALDKDAANVLWDYGKEVTESLFELTGTLKTRYGGASLADKNRIELRNRRWSQGESLKTLHIDVRQLAALAFPDMDRKTREVISCDYFIDALADPELALKIRERQPADLDSALCIALQLEVWTRDSERLAQSMGKAPADAKKVRQFTSPGSGQQPSKQGKNSADVQKELAEQRKLVDEQSKLLEEYQKALAELKVSTHVDTPRPPPSSGAKPWQRRAPFYFWGYGQQGHVAIVLSKLVSQKLLHRKLLRWLPHQCSGRQVHVRSIVQMQLRIMYDQRRAQGLLQR